MKTRFIVITDGDIQQLIAIEYLITRLGSHSDTNIDIIASMGHSDITDAYNNIAYMLRNKAYDNVRYFAVPKTWFSNTKLRVKRDLNNSDGLYGLTGLKKHYNTSTKLAPLYVCSVFEAKEKLFIISLAPPLLLTRKFSSLLSKANGVFLPMGTLEGSKYKTWADLCYYNQHFDSETYDRLIKVAATNPNIAIIPTEICKQATYACFNLPLQGELYSTYKQNATNALNYSLGAVELMLRTIGYYKPISLTKATLFGTDISVNVPVVTVKTLCEA